MSWSIRSLVVIVLLTTQAASATPPEPGDGDPPGSGSGTGLSVYCEGERVIEVGGRITWNAFVANGSGQYQYAWTDEVYGSLPGNQPQISAVYTQTGRPQAQVVVTDLVSGEQATSEPCPMYVIPTTFSEPPSVNPVLWIPENADISVDPSTLLPELNRVYRGIRAEYFHLFGKTFRLNPVRLIQSTFSEVELCGGDCADIHFITPLDMKAREESTAALGGIIPFTREASVLFWGGGGVAYHGRWPSSLGTMGDFTIAAATGIPMAPIEPDLPIGDGVPGSYFEGWRFTMAHELNHGIAWDIPHVFSLHLPNFTDMHAEYTPQIYQISKQSPWMTETPTDTIRPTVTITNPAEGQVISGTTTIQATATDNQQMDAVNFLVDGRLFHTDTSTPYTFPFDTRKVGFGRRLVTAVAFDLQGNPQKFERSVVVRNTVSGGSCSQQAPAGEYRVCFYDGSSVSPANFLGEMRDYPFPLIASNAGYLLHHLWNQDEEVAYGQLDTLTGVWRGTITFPPVNPPAQRYMLRVWADNSIRIDLNNGAFVFDSLGQSVNAQELFVSLSGPTPMRVDWYKQTGRGDLRILFQPTTKTAPMNNPPSVPVLTPPVDQQLPLIVNAGEETMWTVSATDPEGGPVRLSASETLRGAVENLGATFLEHTDGTATFRWTPRAEHAGKFFEIHLTAQDQFAQLSSVSVLIQVPAILAPICYPTFAMPWFEGQLDHLVFSCEDVQGGTLTYTPAGLPQGAMMHPFGDANLDQQLTAADITAMINLVNSAPLVSTPQLAVADLNRDGRITDPDLGLLSTALFQPWKYIVAWRPSFTQGDASYTVTVTVRDPQGHTTPQEMILSVFDLPDLEPIPEQFGATGQVMSFVAFANDDLRTVGYGMGSAMPSGAVFLPLGDVTQNGTLTAADYNTLINLINLGPGSGTPIQRALGDVTRDGQLTGADASLLQQYIALTQPWKYLFAWQPTTAMNAEVFVVATNTGVQSDSQLVSLTSGDCLLATVAYGSPMAHELEPLRVFRDEVLLPHPWGRWLTRAYYRLSPPVARVLKEHDSLRAIMRIGLQPLVRASQHLRGREPR